MDSELEGRGPISWMARNAVAANLLMAVLLVGGLLIGTRVKQEVFPEFELDFVTVTVPYPGASPSEVEQGILLAIEDEIRGLDGIKEVRSRAAEGVGTVSVELLLGTDTGKALQDVKNAVDRVTTFPKDAERPIVSQLSTRREVISIVLYGDLDERSLRGLAEQVRDELLQKPGITLVEIGGVRPLEISIETPQANLRAYGLTLDGIAREVARAAVELPGGGIKTRGGEVLLRTEERRDFGREFGNIPVLSKSDGTRVLLGDIAAIKDGFEDTDEAAFFNGKPAVMVRVFRVGDQTPLGIAKIVKKHLEELRRRLPPGVEAAKWNDWSDIYRERMGLLVRNACIGLVLVLALLGAFLELRLAFWVTMGIPVSFLGALLLMPMLGLSINMISLFAFIMALGIVVDDAIVVGENIYQLRQEGRPYLNAAIVGARLVAVPVVFSVLTNMAAFGPMLFVPGFSGKIFRVIPIIVIAIFTISLIESIFILPAHLGHQRPGRKRGVVAFVFRQQQRIGRLLELFVQWIYRPVLRATLRVRYLTIAVGLALLVLTIGLVAGGRVGFRRFPRLPGDGCIASVALAYGTPVARTRAIQERMVKAAMKVLAPYGGDDITLGIYSQVGAPLAVHGPGESGQGNRGSHLAAVGVSLVGADKRKIGIEEFTKAWREEIGDIPGLESLSFTYTVGPQGRSPIDVQLTHADVAALESAASEVAEALGSFRGVRDIDDGFSRGKPQLDFKLRPEARSLGITAADLGRQVRDSFYGAEAFRQQRGRDEVKVMVRLPESERASEYNLEQLLIRSPAGGEIELPEAARIVRGRAYTEIERSQGRRVMNVTAELVPGEGDIATVLAALQKDVLPGILARHPGLGYSLEGEEREWRDSMSSLGRGFILAMIVIFGMLAVPLKSYIQPIIVMAAIPFGIVGAVIGHMVMGFSLSLVSMMGIVALSGVVVNDSLVLVHATNRYREGKTPFDAVYEAGARRFRPILLTSITTFGGLAPMIFETSFQARILIPLAISLGYGIIFSTLITLLIVPSLYLIVEDLKRLGAGFWRFVIGAVLAAGAFCGLHFFVAPIPLPPPWLTVAGAGVPVLGGLVGWGIAYLYRDAEAESPERSSQ